MPESVDRPAPESTTTSPSATSAARSSRVPGSAAAGSTAVGTAVTAPWSPSPATRAATSGGSDLPVEAAQQLLVHAAQPLGREGALEEAADATGPVPGGADPHGGQPGVGRVQRPGGHHRGAGVGLDQGVGVGLADLDQLVADALGRGGEAPGDAGARALAAGLDPVAAELFGEHAGARPLVVGESGPHPVHRRSDDPFRGGDDLTHGPILPSFPPGTSPGLPDGARLRCRSRRVPPVDAPGRSHAAAAPTGRITPPPSREEEP